MKVQALYQENTASGAVRCLLCPHACTLKEGQVGLCHTRRVEEDTLRALQYGTVTALALDPIEKKPLHHYQPGKQVLSVGSWGCNLRCPFCQNADISQQEVPGKEMTPAELVAEALRLVPAGNIGVAYTYNEPLTWYEFVYDAAKAVHEAGMKNVLVSNGCVNEAPLAMLLPHLDAINFDLKSFNHAFYRQVLGGDLVAVQRSIQMAVAAGVHLEVTFLVLDGENDDPGEFEAMCQWLSGLSREIPLHLSRAFPRYHWQTLAVTPKDTLTNLSAIARRYLKHVHLGNVR